MSAMQTDRRVTQAAVIAAVLVAGLIVVYALSEQLGETTITWAIDMLDVIGAAVCAALCFILWRSSDKGEDLRRVWLFLGIGMALWALAEIFYAVYELYLLEDTPSPSLADILWLPAYIPILLALWLRFRLLRVPLTQTQWIALLGGFIVLVGLSVALVIVPNLPGSEAIESASASLEDFANAFLGVAYSVGDLLMALGAALMIVAMTGGRFTQSWLLVALGCLAIALADSLYYAGLNNGMYAFELPINLFTTTSDISYFVGYALMALGLFSQARLQRAL